MLQAPLYDPTSRGGHDGMAHSVPRASPAKRPTSTSAELPTGLTTGIATGGGGGFAAPPAAAAGAAAVAGGMAAAARRLSKDDNLVHDGRGSLLPPPAFLRARSDAGHAAGDVAGTLMSHRTATLALPCGYYTGQYNSGQYGAPPPESYWRSGGPQQEQSALLLLSEDAALTCPWTSKRRCRRVSHHGDLSNPLVPPVVHPATAVVPPAALLAVQAVESAIAPSEPPSAAGVGQVGKEKAVMLPMLPPKGVPELFRLDVPAPLIAAAHEEGAASCFVTTM